MPAPLAYADGRNLIIHEVFESRQPFYDFAGYEVLRGGVNEEVLSTRKVDQYRTEAITALTPLERGTTVRVFRECKQEGSYRYKREEIWEWDGNAWHLVSVTEDTKTFYPGLGWV